MKDLYADPLAKGVVFTQAPQSQTWEIDATMVDSEGNRLILVEPPDPDAAR